MYDHLQAGKGVISALCMGGGQNSPVAAVLHPVALNFLPMASDFTSLHVTLSPSGFGKKTIKEDSSACLEF